jgi:hypothetical protein
MSPVDPCAVKSAVCTKPCKHDPQPVPRSARYLDTYWSLARRVVAQRLRERSDDGQWFLPDARHTIKLRQASGSARRKSKPSWSHTLVRSKPPPSVSRELKGEAL